MSFISSVHITGASLLCDSKVTGIFYSAIMPKFLSCSYHVKDNSHYKDKHKDRRSFKREWKLTDKLVKFRMAWVFREGELTTLYSKWTFTKWKCKETELVQYTTQSLKKENGEIFTTILSTIIPPQGSKKSCLVVWDK